ncbi:MAG TPA: hypothetical protein VFN78_08070 [Ktedonobacterales bacterium]|nr:hypothetical protein [Ktedonobacterales bacterium]
MMIGMHWFDVIPVLAFIVPIIIGVIWLAPDATRRGQPGWLWALLTIPFGWITLLVYVALRTR